MTRTVNIAGGGLAGLALAAGLRRHGVPVIVREAGDYPRHRVCGEFISGTDPATLETLGIVDCFQDAVTLREVTWHRRGEIISRFRLAQPALGISRYRLDHALRDRVVKLGGEVIAGSRQKASADEGNVWAAGRIPQPGPWIGLKCHFENIDLTGDLEMHLAGNGYVGLARIGEGRVNVCGLFRVDRALRAKGPELLFAYLRAAGNELLVERLQTASGDGISFCVVAGFRFGRQKAALSRCAVGDAESMIPPFTGNGMSMAFQSAEAALDPLEHWSRGGQSWYECTEMIRQRLRKCFHRRMCAAAVMHPLLLHHSGQRFLATLGRSKLLPIQPLLALIR
ncbi:MAG: hypothetical protein V4733_08785 [Verrucomicrobiota bacterium]